MRPGINIELRSTLPARVAPTDTGVWFLAGLTEKGSTTEAVEITSLTEADRLLGYRVSYGSVYDALDVFFREGGSRAYVGRVVGVTPVSAFVVLNDNVAAPTLRVQAKNAGDWGNSLNVQVAAGSAGGTFVLVVSHDTLGELERSPDLLDKAEAFTWANNSDYITLVDQASLLDPVVVAAQSLAGGTDDRATVTDAHWTAALTRFTRDLGPGQVSMPGRTTTAAHTALNAHAGLNNRVAILDAPNVTSKATLLTALDAARSDGKWSAMFWPWDTVPGTTSAPGTDRTVAPSGRVAGNIARTDALGSPNTPAAGENGQSTYATGLSQVAFADADREDLNDAGLNVSIIKYGGVRTYGWRSVANPSSEPDWVNFANSRLLMEIAARAESIGEGFMFMEIDGQGRLTSQFGAALTAVLMEYWQLGSVYGIAPDEAFVVDVGSSVNTPTTLANRELRAVIGIRPSPFAEMITIEIVKSQITQSLS
jgi:phage tail sheath protein FI